MNDYVGLSLAKYSSLAAFISCASMEDSSGLAMVSYFFTYTTCEVITMARKAWQDRVLSEHIDLEGLVCSEM